MSLGVRYHELPAGEDASCFLCKELILGYLDDVTGEYGTPQGYFVEEAETEEFDKAFPYKEKLKLPSTDNAKNAVDMFTVTKGESCK